MKNHYFLVHIIKMIHHYMLYQDKINRSLFYLILKMDALGLHRDLAGRLFRCGGVKGNRIGLRSMQAEEV